MRIGVITLTLAFSMALAFLVVGAFPPVSGAGPCDDSDGDGVCLQDDNCSAKPNASQTDTNSDGYGNACDADYTNDGFVGGPDFVVLSQQYGRSFCDASYDPDVDLTEDDFIGGPDFTRFSAGFGGPPGPSGLACAGVSVPCPPAE